MRSTPGESDPPCRPRTWSRGAEARLACGAVVVGARQGQRPQHTLDGLGTPAGVARRLPTRAGRRRARVVRGVSVDAPFHSARRHPQRPTARGRLDRLEVPVVDHRVAYQRFDFGDDLGCERRFDPPFLAASCEAASSGIRNWASHTRSLASTSSCPSARNWWYSSICWRVLATASGGIILVTVLPFTAWVSEKLGPWPVSPSPRARTVGLAASAIAFHQRPWAHVQRPAPTRPAARRGAAGASGSGRFGLAWGPQKLTAV